MTEEVLVTTLSVDKPKRTMRHKPISAIMANGGGMARGLKSLEDALKYVRREVSEELPIRHLEILLYINRMSEASILHIVRDLGLPKAAASLAVRRLSQFSERNKEGHLELKGFGLLEKERDLELQTMVKIRLSDRGRQIVKGLEEILHG